MKKMGGLELASYLHKHRPEIDILILTAFENFDYAREALRYNVKDYIVKPIYKENLLPPVKLILERQEEKSRNQEKMKTYYQWEAAKNYFPVKTIVAQEELYKEFFNYKAMHQEEKFCIVVMQEEDFATDVELVNRTIQERYRGFIKDFFFSKINEEYVMLLSGIEDMDKEEVIKEKVKSMLSYFYTCKHINITRDIKIDVIHIDGWQKQGDAGAWVWDYERFPDPEEMIYKLKEEGIHLCLWIFPYIDENSKYFKEAEEKGFLVKNTKGVTSRFYSTATSTSKVGCFDFTNPHFLEWYKPKVRSVVSMGIGAVKTDFSEAVPEDAVYFDGSTGIQGHNKLTFLYAKTIYDIMAEVKIPLQNLSWQGGGKVASGMVAAARLGLCCGIMGNVGDDKYGTFCLRDFQDHGIDTEQMCVRKNRTTNFDIVISDEGSMGRSFVFYPGNAECMTEEELNIEYISNSSYFYMANLDSVTKKAAQMAKQRGSKIFMDADSYTDELLDAISWIDIFIGSEFVYEKMLEVGKSVKENCEYLYNKGPEIVIFTFGEKGCAGISKEGFFEIPAFDVDVKDTVGAGDVFHGAFLAAIVKGLSPKDAARFASGVAAIKCTRIGGRAGIPNWEVTDNFLETGEIDYREIDERVKKYGRGLEYV